MPSHLSDWGAGCQPTAKASRCLGASPERNTRGGFFRRTEEPRGGVKAVLPVEARSAAAAAAASGTPGLRPHSRSR